MKKLFILTILLTAGIYSSSAQYQVGQVTVTPLALEESGENLRMEMEIRVEAQAVNKCQSWTVIPVLTTVDESRRELFSRVLINGKQTARKFNRKKRFNNTYLLENYPDVAVNVAPYRDTVFRVEYSAPYEYWMDTARLDLIQILGSCSKKDQYFVVHGTLPVKLESREPYQVVPFINFVEPAPEVKNRTMQGKAFLDFQVGRTTILPNYRRNPEELAKLKETIEKIINDDNVRINAMYIEGFASPEGSYESNDRLSKGRAEALRDYMVQNFRLPAHMFTVSNTAEDWDGLVAMLEHSNMADKDKVLEIIESVGIFEGREARLMNLNGGRTWRTMLGEMFPELRRVEYQADYTVRDFTVSQVKDILETNPEHLSQHEMYLAANTYPEGTEEWERVFELIERHYPDDEVAILNSAAIMLGRGELQSAKRRLDRISDNPIAYNNIGVYYLLTNELDEAEKYLNMARSANSPDASANLEQLEIKRADNKKMERYNNR